MPVKASITWAYEETRHNIRRRLGHSAEFQTGKLLWSGLEGPVYEAVLLGVRNRVLRCLQSRLSLEEV